MSNNYFHVLLFYESEIIFFSKLLGLSQGFIIFWEMKQDFWLNENFKFKLRPDINNFGPFHAYIF